MWKFVLGTFLAAHGLIHLGYLTPAPNADSRYPFTLDKSWLVTSVGFSGEAVRVLGIALCIIAVTGFALAGFAATEVIVPQQWGLLLTIVSSIASLLLLLCFWNTWLVLGIAIDLALLVALLWLGWQPFNAVRA